MTLRESIAAIIQRLEAIKRVAEDYKSSATAAQKREEQARQRGAEAESEELRLAHAAERKRSIEQKKNLCAQWVIGVGTWAAVIAASGYAAIAVFQLCEMRKATMAATKSADAAVAEFEVSQRPWVKIGHRIVSPLAFDVTRNGGPMAIMTLEDTIEDVGQTVAVDVISWEDVIPMGPDNSISAAESRQSQWCDANRHPQMSPSLSGKVLFPRDPLVQDSLVGPSMKVVMKAASESPQGLTGKASFVLVGCVCYRAAFEPKTAPTHQTRFLYYLGVPQDGGWYPWVTPSGIAHGLKLIDAGKFSAD